MIRLIEQTSYKVPTPTSIFIQCDYNQVVVDFLKKLDLAVWHKDKKLWEVPSTELANVVSNLKYVDDLSVELIQDTIQETREYVPIVNYKTQPLPHQLEAIRKGINTDKWLLLDAPGLGKTLDITYIAEELRIQKGLEHCLVICGINTLKTNWESEIHKHSDLSCRILGKKINSKGNVTYGLVKDRALELKNKIDEFFIITNIESFRNPIMQEAFKRTENKIDMVVLDEAHKIKNSQSQSGKALVNIKAKYKIAATGTLLLNSPIDAYTPLQFIDFYHCPNMLTNFKKYFCTFNGQNDYKVTGYKNLNVLKDEIESCSLRRTKDILKDILPPKTLILEKIEMSDEQRELYEKVKKRVKDDTLKFRVMSANDLRRNKNALLAIITRLRQATACPKAISTDNIVSSKLERAQDLVEELLSQNEKVCVFSTFKDSIYELADMLKPYHPLIATGDQKEQEIEQAKYEFQNNPDEKILLATWQKMGTGLTLTAASYMICIDTAWNAGLQDQTEDRIYRIGAERPVFIYRLICENTIDERVQQLLEEKKAMSDYLIDGEITEDALDKLKAYIEDL